MGTTGERDERWFEALVAAELTFVTAYARRRVSDPDDVVAEVFALAWRHRERLPVPPRPWLLRTASHQILHVHRSTMRRTRLVDRLTRQGGTAAVDDHAEATGRRLDAAVLVTAALAELSAADQEILRLHAWEQLDIAEIAYVLVCRPVTAKVRLHRARQRLAAAVVSLSEGGPLDERPTDPRRTAEVTS